MTLTRKTLADAIDAYDAEIETLQSGKRETYAEYRQQLADAGMGKDAVKAEVDATKAAIKRRQSIAKKGNEVIDAKDALTDEIFAEITTGTRNANARVARGARAASDDPAEREARRKMRLSESMLDNIALSADMLRDGLITREQHAENVALSDAVARKLGAGVISPDTGEIIEGNEPASSEAQVRSERSGEGGEDAPALSADTQSQPGRSEAPRQIEAGLVAKVEDQSTAAVRDSTEGIAAPQPLNPEAATTPPAAGRSPVDTHPEPGNGEAGASPAPAPEPAAEGTAHNPIPSAVPGNMQNLHNAPGSIRTERTHTEGVERHQFAVWPEYQGRAHADLVDDVRTNGVREPIVMQGRIILDGWARYLAAREAGVSYPVQEYAGDDPLRDIITLNMASRSLNLVERQSIAKKLTKLAPDRADEIGELLDLQQQREAAQ